MLRFSDSLGHAKTTVVVGVRRLPVVATRRATIVSVVVPRAATQHTGGTMTDVRLLDDITIRRRTVKKFFPRPPPAGEEEKKGKKVKIF